MKQIIALASLALLPFSQVAAEGFQVNAQSTKQAGMGSCGCSLKTRRRKYAFQSGRSGLYEQRR